MKPVPIVLAASEGEDIRTQVDRLIKARSDETGNKFSMAVVTCDAGFSGPPLHRHARHDEVFFILEGTFDFQIDDARSTVEAGGFVYVPAGTAHAFAGDGGGRMLEMFLPGDFEGYFDEVSAAVQSGDRARVQKAQQQYGMKVIGPSIGRGG
jgi:quercetin dioxygenase-like cupin family protein